MIRDQRDASHTVRARTVTDLEERTVPERHTRRLDGVRGITAGGGGDEVATSHARIVRPKGVMSIG